MVITGKEEEYKARYRKALNELAVRVITPEYIQKGDTWGMIEGLVADYTQLHPLEVKDVVENAARLRTSSKERSGRSKQGVRLALQMPPGLLLLIERYEPDVFKNKKKLHEFMRRFPGFCVAERV